MVEPTDSPEVKVSGRTVDIPGVRGVVTFVEPGVFSPPNLLVDGVPAEKVGFFGQLRELPGQDAPIRVRVGQSLSGFYVQTGSDTIPVGPQAPTWVGVLVWLPFALVPIGGALGGLVGGGGMLINRKIAQSARPLTTRILSMVVVFVGAVILWLLLASVFGLLIGP